MPIVLDASALIPIVLPDEASQYSDAVLTHLEHDQAVTATIFWFEIRNALIVNERRKRLTLQETSLFLDALADLPIELDDLPPSASVLELAHHHTLSVYDASYLDLARRTGYPLATLDSALRNVAQTAGVSIFPAES